MFSQHAFDTKIEVDLKIPHIFVTAQAYMDMWHLVDIVDKEVGWYGTVLRDGNDFIIDTIHLPGQECTAGTTEMTNDGQDRMFTEILAQPGGDDLVCRMQFWGHSHVNMEVNPSGTDEEQLRSFGKYGFKWYIRGIFNKKHKAKFDIMFFDTGILIRDVPWSLHVVTDATRHAHWDAQVKEKVKAPVYTPPAYGSHRGNPHYQAPYNRFSRSHYDEFGRLYRDDDYGYGDEYDAWDSVPSNPAPQRELMRNEVTKTPEEEYADRVAKAAKRAKKERGLRRHQARMAKEALRLALLSGAKTPEEQLAFLEKVEQEPPVLGLTQEEIEMTRGDQPSDPKTTETERIAFDGAGTPDTSPSTNVEIEDIEFPLYRGP